jgi:hypothetical protein
MDMTMSSRVCLPALLVVLGFTSACSSTKHDFGPADDGGAGNSGAGTTGGRNSSGGTDSSSAGDDSGDGGTNPGGGVTGKGGTSAGKAGSAGTAAGAGGEAGVAEPTCGAPGTPCCAGDTCDTGASCTAATCACDAKLTACSSSCVDLKADPKNCGVCGHDCLGGDCDLGVCQPFNIVTGQTHVTQLAVDSTNVYWTGSDTAYAHYYVARRRIDGSDAVKPLTSTETGAYAIAIASGNIYWMAGGHLRVCDLPDCSKGPADYIPATIATGCSSDIKYIASKNALYYGCYADYNTNNGSLWSLTLGTVNPVNLVPSPASPVAMASDDANLYWLGSSTYTADSLNKDGVAARIRLSDGTKTTLAAGLQGDIYSFAVGGTALYFAGNQINTAPGTGNAIYKVPLPNGLGGAAAPKFADASSIYSTVGSMTADDQYLYYSESDNSGAGSIKRCPHTGCATPETIAPGQAAYGGSLIQDSASLFWSTGVGVGRLAK